VARPTPYIYILASIKWRNPPLEAGPRTRHFYRHKKGGSGILGDKGGRQGLDILLGRRTRWTSTQSLVTIPTGGEGV